MVNLDDYKDGDVLPYELCRQITCDGYRPIYDGRSYDCFFFINDKNYIHRSEHYDFLWMNEAYAVTKRTYINFYKVHNSDNLELDSFLDSYKDNNDKKNEIKKQMNDILEKDNDFSEQFDFIIKHCKNSKKFFLEIGVHPYKEMFKRCRYIDIDSYTLNFNDDGTYTVVIEFCDYKSRAQNHYDVETEPIEKEKLIEYINKNYRKS